MTTKSFTTTKVASTHGTRPAAEAERARLAARSGSHATYTVEHTGPRLFVVIAAVTVTSEPAEVTTVFGNKVTCECGSAEFFYTGRTLFHLNYECAAECGRTISPLSETGASQ